MAQRCKDLIRAGSALHTVSQTTTSNCNTTPKLHTTIFDLTQMTAIWYALKMSITVLPSHADFKNLVRVVLAQGLVGA